jgi:hypothetical protein
LGEPEVELEDALDWYREDADVAEEVDDADPEVELPKGKKSLGAIKW